MNNQIDLSRELLLRPHLNGVVLTRQENGDSRFMPFGDLMESSMATFIMNTESRVADANDATLHLNHVPSLKGIVGLNALDVWDTKQARAMMKNDFDVMNNQDLLITDDSAINNFSGYYEPMLSFKMPLYREESVVGVLGVTLKIDTNNITRLASQLTTLTQSGLIASGKIKNLQRMLNTEKAHIYFTRRELDVLTLVFKGRTAKEISRVLNISKRTVEHHIENIKQKSGCKTKFDLMVKFLHQFPA